MRNSKGFTLIEIIVAVALVAILSAAVAPSVLNNIAQGRVSRAQSDVQAIASAVVRFKTEVGMFPNQARAGVGDSSSYRVSFLVSSSGDFPGESSIAGNWPNALSAGYTAGSAEKINSHLIKGYADEDTTNYRYPRTASNNPADVGFRGGLLSADTPDPWGHPYFINVGMLDSLGQNVWVLSAGPNGTLETYVEVNTGYGVTDTLGGDDIGFKVK